MRRRCYGPRNALALEQRREAVRVLPLGLVKGAGLGRERSRHGSAPELEDCARHRRHRHVTARQEVWHHRAHRADVRIVAECAVPDATRKSHVDVAERVLARKGVFHLRNCKRGALQRHAVGCGEERVLRVKVHKVTQKDDASREALRQRCIRHGAGHG